MTRCLSWLFVLGCAALAAGQAESKLPPIVQLKQLRPQPSVFGASDRLKPLVISSEDEAGKHFAADDLVELRNHVDLDKQRLLVFAWRGSGQDRLEFAVQESMPEQVVFTYTPGRTRDYRPHVLVYALRDDVKWTIRSSGSGPRRSGDSK